MWLINQFPNLSVLESAAIEDIAFLALEQAKRERRYFHPGNIVNAIDFNPHSTSSNSALPRGTELERMKEIASEAFAWLEAERLIARNHADHGGTYIITRVGATISESRDLSSYAKRAYLPRDVLHERVSEVSLAPFLAGRYDEAVRDAFTRVEVAVRTAAGYGNGKYGVTMMREAFAPGKPDGSGTLGPLTDPELEFTEREAVAHLFAGAIGYIKNPLSHRELNIDDARLAASRILLANDLMHTLAAHVEGKSARASAGV
jgi:uncharacterized protein (TIGR02391 family)